MDKIDPRDPHKKERQDEWETYDKAFKKEMGMSSSEFHHSVCSIIGAFIADNEDEVSYNKPFYGPYVEKAKQNNNKTTGEKK